MRINYAIVFVSDMEKSITFYRDVLGIKLKFQTPYWTEFMTDGSTLALHHTDESAAVATKAESEPAGSCRTGFNVANLEEFHRRMSENNVMCVREPTEVFGSMIANYVDPDGMVFSVSETARGEQQD